MEPPRLDYRNATIFATIISRAVVIRNFQRYNTLFNSSWFMYRTCDNFTRKSRAWSGLIYLLPVMSSGRD